MEVTDQLVTVSEYMSGEVPRGYRLFYIVLGDTFLYRVTILFDSTSLIGLSEMRVYFQFSVKRF